MKSKTLVSVALFALLSGCASSLSVLPIERGKDVVGEAEVIVLDARQFEDWPWDPQVPSLGLQSATNAPAETLARAVGRKRNGVGEPGGSVLLAGTTVADLVAGSLRRASPGTPMLVRVNRFWTWTQGGAMMTLITQIDTDIEAHGRHIRVATETQHIAWAATEGHWMQAINTALDQYEAKARQELAR